MTAAQSRVSAAEYLAAERAGTERHEYFDGVVRAMAGGSYIHAQLAARIGRLLATQLAERGCEVVGSDLKVKNAVANSYVYPDAAVICETPSFDDEQRDVLLNPTAVVEVISRSTEALDRGEKAQVYRGIASLTTFVLVSQYKPHIEWYERAGAFWVLHEAQGFDAVASLAALDVTISLAELYGDIEFETAGDTH